MFAAVRGTGVGTVLSSPTTVIVNSKKASLNFSGNKESLGSATGVADASSIIFALPASMDAGSIETAVIALNRVVGLVGGMKAPGATKSEAG